MFPVGASCRAFEMPGPTSLRAACMAVGFTPISNQRPGPLRDRSMGPGKRSQAVVRAKVCLLQHGTYLQR
jgi:hypothetical protein